MRQLALFILTYYQVVTLYQEPLTKVTSPHPSTKIVHFSVAEALEPIQMDLIQLHEILPTLIPAETQTSHQVIQYVFSQTGKRIRPSLFLLCSRLVGYDGSHKLTVAAICEYIHTASLLHDDVVDNSMLRRGIATANSKWGNQAAVLVGDLIYSTACELMASTESKELIKSFANAICRMSDGELLQLENIGNPYISKETYLKVLEGKTGVLLGASAAAAGYLNSSPKNVIDGLFSFGNYLGLAFQVIDDILDYSSSSQKLGKPILQDIKEGKVTIPLLIARDLATKEEQLELVRIIANRRQNESELAYISSLIDKYDALELASKIADSFTEKSLEGLQNAFPPSKPRDQLEALTRALLARKY